MANVPFLGRLQSLAWLDWCYSRRGLLSLTSSSRLCSICPKADLIGSYSFGLGACRRRTKTSWCSMINLSIRRKSVRECLHCYCYFQFYHCKRLWCQEQFWSVLKKETIFNYICKTYIEWLELRTRVCPWGSLESLMTSNGVNTALFPSDTTF